MLRLCVIPLGSGSASGLPLPPPTNEPALLSSVLAALAKLKPGLTTRMVSFSVLERLSTSRPDEFGFA
jgi:hypothetical protein